MRAVKILTSETKGYQKEYLSYEKAPTNRLRLFQWRTVAEQVWNFLCY